MRKLSKVFLAISLAFSLTACGYGSVPETTKMGPAGSGIDSVVGEIKVQEILVINDGTTAVLTAVIINSSLETETLLGATVGNRLVELVETSSGVTKKIDTIEIPARSSVSLSFAAPLGALLNNTDAELPTIGTVEKVNFSFAANGFVKVEALVFANEGIYSTVNPSAFALN